MIGFLIALIMFGIDFVNHVANEKALLDASLWLYNWSFVWAIIVGLFLFIGVFINITNDGAFERFSRTVGGLFLGVLSGTGLRYFNFGYLVVCAINTSLLLGGSYLMQSSGNMVGSAIDERRFIIGAMLVAATVIMRVMSFIKLKRGV